MYFLSKLMLPTTCCCAGILKLELCDHVATISSLNFAPHPSVLLVSASMDGTLKLWDMSDDGNMIKTLRTKCTAFYGCRWSPDATALATVGNYHSVNIVSSSRLSLLLYPNLTKNLSKNFFKKPCFCQPCTGCFGELGFSE